MKTQKKIINLLKFTINEKAVNASKQMRDYVNENKDKYNFSKGQYMAFSEVYLLLNNII